MYFLNFIVIVLFGFASTTQECKNVPDKFEYHLGTKTPYRLVANTDTAKLDFEGCEAQKIWMIVRHGTRNPSADLIIKMNDRLPEIRDLILENNSEPSERLRNSDLYALRKWKSRLEESDETILAHEGEDEMLELAERMQARFPSLFPSTYSNTSYYSKYTASQRTKASAKYFAAGLFGRQSVRDVWYPKPSKRDPILRFYKLCSRWKNEIKDNPKSIEQMKQFEKSPHMLQAIESVNKELNLENDLVLEDVHLMYMTCAFETAWNRKKKSPWCSALTPQALKAIEFAEDLKYYYRDGYGYELTYAQACTAFNDMINYFESDSKYPKATVYFTHSGTLLKMLAHLGLYKDPKALTKVSFDSNDHKWRVSKIDAFGTNLAFVLYRCDQKQKVVVLHQERITQLPNCDDMCDLQNIKQHYSNSINNCAFDEMCSNNKS